MRDERESFEGQAILDELEDQLGLVLWQALRDVMLWAETPPERRDGLFGPLAASARAERIGAQRLDPAVELALAPLVLLVRDPAGADEEAIADACRQLARWASERGLRSTAIGFAQAAAVSRPADARAALEVGRMAVEAGAIEPMSIRRKALNARAETWLRRAIGVARRAREWSEYAAAYLTLAELYRTTYRAGLARDSFVRVLRIARRHALTSSVTPAHRGLLRLAVDSKDRRAAERHLRRLLRADRHNEQAPYDALRDYGRTLLMLEDPARACALLKRAVASTSGSAEKLEGLALLARAAVEAENDRLQDTSWEQVRLLLTRMEPGPTNSAALLEVTRAALVLSDWAMLNEAGRLTRMAAERSTADSDSSEHAKEVEALLGQAAERWAGKLI